MEELRLRGNALFASNPRAAAALYQEALSLYNSLKDKNNSLEEYTKCAGNALTCLFKIEEYEACVQLAFAILQVNPLIAKAYAFIGRCILRNISNNNNNNNITITNLPNNNAGALQYLCRAVYLLPSMCETTLPFIREALNNLLTNNNNKEEEEPCIEVRESNCGKCVVAASQLPALLPVSSTLEPFSVCSYMETNCKRLCSNCGIVIIHNNNNNEKKNLNSCEKCHLVQYCSEECKSHHFLQQHQPYECHFFIRLQDMQLKLNEIQNNNHNNNCEEIPDDLFIVASHCISTISAIKSHRNGYKAVLQLESHASEVSQQLAPLVRLTQDIINTESHEYITRIIGIIRCNALEVCEASGLPIGQALHAANITSYFNHSCNPNCAIEDEENIIITTRTIAPGEELTIAYMPQLYWPTRLRQEELAGRYFFKCQCTRCCCKNNNNNNNISGDPFEVALTSTLQAGHENNNNNSFKQKEKEHIAAVQILCSRLRAKDVSEININDRNDLLRLLKECRQHLFPFHYLCHELHNTLSFVYAVLGDSKACLRSCIRELLLWESIVPGAFPVKRLKLQNALRCSSELDNFSSFGNNTNNKDDDEAYLLLLQPLLVDFARLYGVN